MKPAAPSPKSTTTEEEPDMSDPHTARSLTTGRVDGPGAALAGRLLSGLVGHQFTIFGSSGALVAALLTAALPLVLNSHSTAPLGATS
jgi:hypothetical protein